MSGRFSKPTRHKGLSKVVIRHGRHNSRRTSEALPAGKQEERRTAQSKRRQAAILELMQEDRATVRQMDLDNHGSSDDVDMVLHIPPPGEEGHEISHEGGEHNIFNELVDDLEQSTGKKRIDHRTRRDRIEIQTSNWEIQMERLVEAYLHLRLDENGEGLPLQVQPASFLSVSAYVVDTYYAQEATFNYFTGAEYPNEVLLRHGYLGCSPLQPTIAISIRTLALYRQSHRTSPRFSIESQCRTLCHMQNIPYNPYFPTQFSIAYDAYLEICRRVDKAINLSLGYDEPNSRLLRSCPACFYKLKDEPKLEFSSFISIDGNNSLKRLRGSVHQQSERLDTRGLLSDRWLTREQVDHFKDEVKSRSTHKCDDEPLDDWEDIQEDQSGGTCVERWRNARPEERKRTLTLFDESGIFIASCRHRMVLLVCDMIRSGELAKYPLAIVDHLIDILGENVGCAYDIGCSFSTTLKNSTLASKIAKARFRLMVGSFHGHAHNRGCQVNWHPLYIKGTGNTEGEGCEHVFSSSNDLARGTRHASRFHRHQAIEEHFNFWDEDKYANLSQFLQNHYREALLTIRTLEEELSLLKAQLGITGEEFEDYFAAEKDYLTGLKQPSPETVLKTRYVMALNELKRCHQEWNNARTNANIIFTSPMTTRANLNAAITQSRRQLDSAYAKVQNAETLVGDLEGNLGIEKRWTGSTPEFKEHYQQTVQTTYLKALDELERLVVMRLFELAKLNMSGTGYKIRNRLGKALQKRSDAIRNALNRYNAQAAQLDPPRPPLTWKEIVDYTIIGEFDFLRYSRVDIRGELWTRPAQREGMVKWFKLCRAREEIDRLNVEMCRLRTFIHDETKHFQNVILGLSTSNPPLCAELRRRWALRTAINDIHIKRLDMIEKEAGFTGGHSIGVRLGSTSTPDETLHMDEAEAESDFNTLIDKLAEFVIRIAD